MFEHPGDVLTDRSLASGMECGQPVGMNVGEQPGPSLPHTYKDGEYIPRISREIMVDVLHGKFDAQYDRRLVVDCRFEYEFNGGHVDGAVNYNDKEKLVHDLFAEPSTQKTLLIFHCEYSELRAPITAKHIREADRIANVHQYPLLSYPEIYILDGGYKSFFNDHRTFCFPQNYIQMDDKAHEYACERGLGKIKQTRNKLSRAQTFAFGQSMIEESPTAVPRFSSNALTTMSMDICIEDRPFILQPLGTRRIQSL